MKSTQFLSAALLCPVLAACSPPAPSTDLCRYVPAGTQTFALEGGPSLAMDNEIIALSLNTRRQGEEKRRHCGQGLTAAAGVDDAAIVAAIQQTLGAGWQYRSDYRSLNTDIRVHLWQSTGHTRPSQYYALVSYQKVISRSQDAQPPAVRPLETVYIGGN